MERHGLALPQLDPELLCMIWKHLDLETFRNPQHALRCTCKALRDVSNAWISSAEISAGGRVYLSYHEDDVLPAECALAQLGRFPKSAVLRSLAWSCEVEMVDDDDEESPQQALMLHALQLSLDVLPSFLFQARDRLTCLTSFTWSRQILTCGDVAALANTCPQLQHLEVYDATVFGPVFSPLHRLASFSSLMLDNVVTTHQHLPVLVSSLVPLTSLTKLGICNMPVLSRSKNLIPLVPSAVPTLLPWLSSLQQLRHLHLEMCPWREDGDFDLKEAGQLLMKHISCLYHLTHIQTFRVPLLLLGPGSTLLSPCPALACAPNLTELTIKDQVLDTPLIRMFAAMPRLTSLTVKGLRLDTDVSQLRCSLQEVTVSDSISLQQLIWLPRGIQRLQLGQAIRWVLQEGDTLEGACRDLQRAAQLLTESPGWKWLKLQPKLCTTPAFSAPGPQSAGGAQATAWQALCQALAPLLKLLSLVDCTVSEKCALSADAVLQGAKWLPEAHLLIVDPRTPGLGPFLAALGETGWLQSIEFRAVQSVAPLAVGVAQIMFDDGIVDALHRMVEKRTAVAKRLFVSSVMRHLTPAQQASLKQASGYQGGVVEGVVVLR